MKIENNSEMVLREMESGKPMSEVAKIFGCTKEACYYFRKKRGLGPVNIYPKHSKEERLAKSSRQKGRKHSQETRNKISSSNAGKKISEEQKKNHSLKMKGLRPSLESRIKRSRSMIINRESHPSWKGGITKENYRIRHSFNYRLWREAVFSRDNFKCQQCGIVGGRLHAHHIKSFADFPGLRFSIENGKTMCVPCHGFLHKRNFSGLYK